MRWHLKGKPWEVQEEALRRSSGQGEYFYAMEPRLGKTPVTLNDWVERSINDSARGAVITCPNHLKYNWEAEMKEWMASVPNYCIWPDEPTNKHDALIINWEAWYHIRSFRAIRDFYNVRGGKVFSVFDESQRMKTHNTATAKAVIGLLSEFEPDVRLLSGTPVTQSVMDWWPQLRAVGLLRGTNPYAFRNRYAVMGGYMGKKVTGTRNEDELNEIMAPRVFRALTADWRKDLPSQTWGIAGFEMTKRQRELYKQMQEDFIIMLQDVEVAADMVITQLLKLQQIARGFVKQGDQVLSIFDKPEDNPSLQALKAAVDEEQGKTIIFTAHRHTCHEVYKAFDKWGYHPVQMIGGMDPKETHDAKVHFNTDSTRRVLVAQTSVAKEGHDLTAGQSKRETACALSIYYENTYNLGDRQQSEKRNHGPLQSFPVRYLDMVGSPIDAKVVKEYGEKKASVAKIADTIRALPRRAA